MYNDSALGAVIYCTTAYLLHVAHTRYLCWTGTCGVEVSRLRAIIPRFSNEKNKNKNTHVARRRITQEQ